MASGALRGRSVAPAKSAGFFGGGGASSSEKGRRPRRGKAAGVIGVKARDAEGAVGLPQSKAATLPAHGKSGKSRPRVSTSSAASAGAGGDVGGKSNSASDQLQALKELEQKRSAMTREQLKRQQAAKEKEELRQLREAGKDSSADPMTTLVHGLKTFLRGGHSLGVYAADYSVDGTKVASCSHDGAVVVWDMGTGSKVRKFHGHRGAVYQVAFSPDRAASRIATVGSDGCLRVFDARTGELRVQLEYSEPIQCCGWNAEGTRIATGGRDRAVVIWNVSSAETHAVELKQGKRVAGDFVSVLIAPPPENADGHRGTIRRVFWQSANFVVSASDDQTIKSWNTRRLSMQHRYIGHAGPVLDVAGNSDGSCLVSASQDGTARIWQFSSGKCTQVLRGHRGVVYCAKFTAEGNGRRVLTGGHDRSVCVWLSKTGTLLQRMSNIHKSFVFGISARFDGLQFITAGGDHNIGVWRALPVTSMDKLKLTMSSCGGCCKSLFTCKSDIEDDAVSVAIEKE